MDAVLPVTAASCARAVAFLLPSLRRHYRDLDTLWVASPAADQAAVTALVQPAMPEFRVRFCADEELVPEFRIHERLGFPRVGGWYRQQLVKLAFAEHVTSEFYLVLDDDLLAVSDFGDHDCLPAGRALRGQDRAGHRARNLPPDSPSNLDVWLTWSARVLQCEPLDYQPDVTPCILARSPVRPSGSWPAGWNSIAGRRPPAGGWTLC